MHSSTVTWSKLSTLMHLFTEPFVPSLQVITYTIPSSDEDTIVTTPYTGVAADEH